MEFTNYLERKRQDVDRFLESVMPKEATAPETLHKAMRYSLFAAGKRVRPILAIAAYEAIGGSSPAILPCAAALELIHTYSLVHDDLPALDNDDYRRGSLTCHKVFGEAMAILTGDALLTFAFQVLSKCLTVDDRRKTLLIGELSEAGGTAGGMIGGQVADLEGEGQPPDAALLESIHRAKTGALLRASVRMGAIYAGAGPDQLAALSAYGQHIGLAFQMI